MRIFTFLCVVIIVVVGAFAMGRYYTIKEDVEAISSPPKASVDIEGKDAEMETSEEEQESRQEPDDPQVRSPKRSKPLSPRSTEKDPRKRKSKSRRKRRKSARRPVKKGAGAARAPEKSHKKSEPAAVGAKPKRDPEKAEKLFGQAIANLDSDRVDEAIPLFESAITLDQDILGENDKGLLKEMFFRREQAFTRTPENNEIKYDLARVYYLGGRAAEALPILKKIEISSLPTQEAAYAAAILQEIEQEQKRRQAYIEAEKKRQQEEEATRQAMEEEQEQQEEQYMAEQKAINERDAQEKRLAALQLRLDELQIKQDILQDKHEEADRKYSRWNRKYRQEQSDQARTMRVKYKNDLGEIGGEFSQIESEINIIKEQIVNLETEIRRQQSQEQEYE